MKKIIAPLIVAGITLMTALPTMAQRKPLSPHDTVSGVIDGNRITITYGRPYTIKPGTTEVRKIWGVLVPYDKPWRMGANEATTLITQKPIEIAGKTIPAGAYTLYMVPSESGASHLVFSSALGGWGEPVDTQHDVAQVELTKEVLDQPVDQFTMAVAKASAGGTLQLMWEKTKYSVAFTVQK